MEEKDDFSDGDLEPYQILFESDEKKSKEEM